MIVTEVRDAADFADFLALGRRPAVALGVPLLEPTVRSWWRTRSPHPTRVRLLLVRDADGAPVARAVTHRDDRFDVKLGVRAQLFGAVEAIDATAFCALIAELERLAVVAGAVELVGPFALLPNQSGGVITSGFDQRGFVDAAWNESWLPEAYEREGFVRWYEADTYLVDPVGAGAAGAPDDAELAAREVRIERVRRRGLSRALAEFRPLLNAAFEQLPYYTPISADELRAQTAGLGLLLDPGLFLLARDVRTREAVGFVLAMPDVSRFVQRHGGRFGIRQVLALLLTRHRYREDAVIVVQGARPDRQGQGIVTLLSRQLHANLAAGGYRAVRGTPIGRDNPGSARQLTRFGGRVLHGTTYYRRPVNPATAGPAAPNESEKP